jgi:tRNA pseudouridine55 synthase
MTQPALDQPAKVKTVWQNVNGIVLLDKALGASSNQALQQVRRVFKAAKAGHTGTLDPLATGLLPLCLGEASKFAQGLLDADKTYIARLCLGVMTATGDAEGEVLVRQAVKFSQTQLDQVVARFTGAIEQIPPMYSALKHQGRPLYELARQGIDIARAPRPVTIYSLKVLGSSFENGVDCEAGQAWIDIEAKVSKGTYIRTLGQDIGAALGCGAHLSALRRTAVAAWTIDDAATLETLQHLDEAALKAKLLATDAMLESLATVKIDAAQQILFSNGGRVRIEAIGGDIKPTATVKVYRENKFLGVAELKNGVLHPIRLIGKE